MFKFKSICMKLSIDGIILQIPKSYWFYFNFCIIILKFFKTIIIFSNKSITFWWKKEI